MHRWRLDRLLFPKVVQRASQLLEYAKKQVKMRMEADPSKGDFFSHIQNAKEDDGSPFYKTERQVFSEARALIIGGMSASEK